MGGGHEGIVVLFGEGGWLGQELLYFLVEGIKLSESAIDMVGQLISRYLDLVLLTIIMVTVCYFSCSVLGRQ